MFALSEFASGTGGRFCSARLCFARLPVGIKKGLCRLAEPLFVLFWLRGLDLNQRPSGYEPDELPDCSTPRYRMCVFWMVSRDEKAAARCAPAAAFLKS